MGPEQHRAISDAAWNGDARAVALMLELGFDPRTPGQDSGTALHCAAWEGSAETVSVLLRHPDGRALVSIRDARHNATPARLVLPWLGERQHKPRPCRRGAITSRGRRAARPGHDRGVGIGAVCARSCAPAMSVSVSLIAVPYDSGQRGVRMGAGPEALLQAGLRAALVRDGHDVETEVIEAPGPWRAEIATTFALAAAVAKAARRAREVKRFPLLITGNCMMTLGLVAAARAPTSVVWLDAHGDFNTPETTIGGFIDGMSLATMTGRCWTQLASAIEGFQPVEERRVVLAGARDLDPLEAQALNSSSISARPRRIHRRGAGDRGRRLLVRRHRHAFARRPRRTRPVGGSRQPVFGSRRRQARRPARARSRRLRAACQSRVQRSPPMTRSSMTTAASPAWPLRSRQRSFGESPPGPRREIDDLGRDLGSSMEKPLGAPDAHKPLSSAHDKRARRGSCEPDRRDRLLRIPTEPSTQTLTSHTTPGWHCTPRSYTFEIASSSSWFPPSGCDTCGVDAVVVAASDSAGNSIEGYSMTVDSLWTRGSRRARQRRTEFCALRPAGRAHQRRLGRVGGRCRRRFFGAKLREASLGSVS